MATTKKATTKKVDEKKVDKKTAEVTITRTVKYNYPEDCLGQGPEKQLAKKKYRAKVRAQIKKLALKLEKAPTETAKKRAQAQLNKYRKTHLA